MTPHTKESTILSSYLLTPATLPQILSFSQFQALFPSSYRSRPQLKSLYRDLQFSRSVDVDLVRQNVIAECRRGARQRLELLRAIRAERSGRQHTGNTPGPQSRRTDEEDGLGDDRDVAIDISMLGSAPGTAARRDRDVYHDVGSLIQVMKESCDQLEAEVTETESATSEALTHLKETVGGLSDLRYGRFPRASGTLADNGLENEIVENLKALQHLCDRAAAPRSGIVLVPKNYQS